jgi:hypothetical protein
MRYILGLTASLLATCATAGPPMASAAGWSAPTTINSLVDARLSSVSCVSASFCAAVDSNGTAVTYNGHSWSAPVTIDAEANTSDEVPFSVSCVSPSFCAAVDDHGNAMTYNGSSWSRPIGIDDGMSLTSVSCPSASFCTAVDDFGNAITYNGNTWSTATFIFLYPLISVSCPSVSFCTAINHSGYAVTYNGIAWSNPTSIDPSAPHPPGLNASGITYAVSCTSAAFCVTVGADAFDQIGTAWIYNGNTWAAAGNIDPQVGGTVGILSVSCASASFCFAGGSGGALYYNGSTWSAPTPTNGHESYMGAVSCLSASFCVAVGGGDAITYPGKAAPRRTRAHSHAPPTIKRIVPSGGPYSRPTEITLRGSGFRRGSRVYRAGTRVGARDVKFVSGTELRVRMPRVRMDQSGQQTITVRTGHKTSDCKDPNQITCNSHFNYYVPQIGALVYYTGANDPAHGFPGYGSCTATVVRSANQNTIVTANHCVFDEGVPSKDLYFAPGYYGWLDPRGCQNKYSSGTVPPPPVGSAEAYLACGTAPYGVWKLTAYWTDSNNFSEANYDYAYAHVEERPGTSLEHAVGGGLPISFCPGQKESKHFMAGCDGGSGESFRWAAYGDPQLREGSPAKITTHLVHCGPGAVQHGNLGGPGPDAMGLACSALKPGASGGPWIDQNGDVGAVNHSCCQNIQDPTNTSATPNVTGVYLGDNAQNRWREIEGTSYLCTNQNFCNWKP